MYGQEVFFRQSLVAREYFRGFRCFRAAARATLRYMNNLLASDSLLRVTVFLGVLAAVAIVEALSPRRPRTLSRWLRWSNNLGIVIVDTIALRLVFPVLAVGLAVVAAERGWGFFNVVPAPAALAFVVSLLVFDLVIYLQHVLLHAVPVLWRLHAMHHADTEIDVTTGLRFHPVEILLSMGLKLAVVVVLGPPASAVLAFEIVLNATAMFNHGNIRMPESVDRVLRLLVVTPDMHRVHHSIVPEETNSNYGFNFPWWDRLLGTYRAQPAAGHDEMVIGLEQFRAARDAWLDRMLLQPLRGP